MVKQAFIGLAAAFLGLVLVLRTSDGSAAAVIQSWYQPLLFLTMLALLLLGAFVALPSIRAGGRVALQRPRPAALLTVALVALPLVVGLTFKPQPLASKSLATHGASGQAFRQLSAGSVEPARRNVFQWAYEFETARVSSVIGEPVDVIAFVYRTKDMPPDHFSAGRYVVACCIADARGYTLPVHWKDAELLQNDAWVRVQGRVAIGPDGLLMVQANSVENIAAPSNPYIYP
jgi:putative membrane protein